MGEGGGTAGHGVARKDLPMRREVDGGSGEVVRWCTTGEIISGWVELHIERVIVELGTGWRYLPAKRVVAGVRWWLGETSRQC